MPISIKLFLLVGVGPELAHLKEIDRAEFVWASDEEALEALIATATTEGIIVALESAHAIAWVIREAPKMKSDQIILVGDANINHMLSFFYYRAGQCFRKGRQRYAYNF